MPYISQRLELLGLSIKQLEDAPSSEIPTPTEILTREERIRYGNDLKILKIKNRQDITNPITINTNEERFLSYDSYREKLADTLPPNDIEQINILEIDRMVPKIYEILLQRYGNLTTQIESTQIVRLNPKPRERPIFTKLQENETNPKELIAYTPKRKIRSGKYNNDQ
jgi:hypothetical protein